MRDHHLIDETDLAGIVEAFYAAVRADGMLGPIFNDAVDDWPAHLGTLRDFWSSVMLGTGRYKGNPMAAHLKHRERMAPEHFVRWLSLWKETTDRLAPPPAAAQLQARAERIAASLQLALFYKASEAREAVY